MTENLNKNIIIATAIVIGTQLLKNCEYSDTSSSDSEIEELLLLKVSYCSLRLITCIIISCTKCFIL